MRRTALLSAFFLIGCCCCEPGLARQNFASRIINAAAKAYGPGLVTSVHVRGKCVLHGAQERFDFFSGRELQCLWTARGPLPETMATDGDVAWIENWSQVPHEEHFEGKDETELVNLVWSGGWTDPHAPLIISGETHPNTVTVLVGNLQAHLIVNRETHLPNKLVYHTTSGDQVWNFGDYHLYAKRKLPGKVVHHEGAQTDIFNLESVAAGYPEESLFKMPSAPPDDTRLEAHASPVQIKRVGGYLFVRPVVDGTPCGWFFLDSGADAMCIDPKLASKLNLKRVGSETVAGVVATTSLDIYQGRSFSLGPASYGNPVFLALDLSGISKAFGMEIDGICGYDFLARFIVDLEPSGGLSFYTKPADVQNLSWRHINFSGNTPALLCTFEGGRQDQFTLDTGSGATVDFTNYGVTKFKLLDGRRTTKAIPGGAGGQAESLNGHIAYFTVGDHRYEIPEVGFQLATKGAFSTRYLAGNVGMGFLRDFRIVFDYPHGRMALEYRGSKG